MASYSEVCLLTLLYVSINMRAHRKGLLTPIPGVLCVGGYLLGYALAILAVLNGWYAPSGRAYFLMFLRGTGISGAMIALGIIYLLRNRLKYMAAALYQFSGKRNARIRTLHISLGIAAAVIGYVVIIASGEKIANSMAWVFFGFAIWDTSHNLFNLAWRYGLPTSIDILEKDKRRPVLLLRSFLLDQYAEAVSSGRLPISFEADLATGIFKEVGPFLAFADPKDRVPVVGAAREQEDGDWQARFKNLAENAAAILVIEGETAGLHVELIRLREWGLLDKVLLLTLPYESFFTSLHKKWWPSFKDAMSRAQWRMPEEDLPAGTIISYQDGQACVLQKKIRSKRKYANAIIAELKKRKVGGPPALSITQPAPNWWIQLPLATIIGLVIPLTIGSVSLLAGNNWSWWPRLLAITGFGLVVTAITSHWKEFFGRKRKYDVFCLGSLLLWFSQRIEVSIETDRLPSWETLEEMLAGWLVLVTLTAVLSGLLTGQRRIIYGAPESRLRSGLVKTLGYILLPALTGCAIGTIGWIFDRFQIPNAFLITTMAALVTRFIAKEHANTYDVWTGRYYPLAALPSPPEAAQT